MGTSDEGEGSGRERRNTTVLLADDSLLIRRLVQASLASRGYEVLEAEDGAEAVAIAEAEAPDVIVLDRQMPNLDGFEVVRRLRAAEVTRETPILMLTEHADGDEFVEREADEFMAKPFTPDDLGAALERILAARAPGATNDSLP